MVNSINKYLINFDFIHFFDFALVVLLIAVGCFKLKKQFLFAFYVSIFAPSFLLTFYFIQMNHVIIKENHVTFQVTYGFLYLVAISFLLISISYIIAFKHSCEIVGKVYSFIKAISNISTILWSILIMLKLLVKLYFTSVHFELAYSISTQFAIILLLTAPAFAVFTSLDLLSPLSKNNR